MNEYSILTKIGAKIKSLRQSKGMTQQDLAEKCGFEKASLSRIETGQTNSTLRTLLRITEALELPITSLFTELA